MSQLSLVSITIIIVFVLLCVLAGYALLTQREGYKDPIYLYRSKISQDLYPRSNGSIYGHDSNIFTGYPYYSKAY